MNHHDGLHNVLISGTAAIALQHPAATNTKTSQERFLGTARRLVTDRSWLKAAEGVTLWGSVAGAVCAAVSQQAMFAVPLSLSVGLSWVNRRRWEETMQRRVANLTTEVAQLQNSQHPGAIDLSRNSCGIGVSPVLEDRYGRGLIEIASLTQRVETLEQADLPQRLTVLQQWVTDLDDSVEGLCDRALHLDRVTQQLQAQKQSVSAPGKSLRGRVAIFIDGANLFYAAQELGIEIDYLKLLKFLTAGSPLFRAYFYTGIDSTNEKQQGFLLWLRRNGYQVVGKEVVQRANGSKKANLDVEMAMDIVSLAGAYDTAVLVSGDGDLACCLNKVSFQGAKVEVVSLRSMTSEVLIDVADSYVDLNEIKGKICRASGCF